MAVSGIIPFLVGMMLLTGCANTILTKYQDQQCIRNCDDLDPTKHHAFEQPVIQTVQMFIGESGCWLVIFGFYIYRRVVARAHDQPLLYQPVNTEEDEEDEEEAIHRSPTSPALKPLIPNADDRAPLQGWKIALLALPSTCDLTGTTLMNVGLLFVAASIYQMTRGALVLFVGLFSVLFLGRKLYLYHWLSLVIVVLGVAVVGLAGAVYSGDKDSSSSGATLPVVMHSSLHAVRDLLVYTTEPTVLRTILGIFLIAFAQVFTATQFCLEEWILEKYALEPLKVVAWEGLFGFAVTVILQIILHFTVGVSPKGRFGYFDAQEGYRQMLTNRVIGLTSIAIMFSIGGFNFFGLSVTRSISATSRSIIDTCRTLFIWLVSLGLGWESFKWLQVVGFALLVYGTFMFNDLVRPPIKALLPRNRADQHEHEELLPEGPIDHL
ncbi:hypothetical protein PV10_08968 [Exophiala mesophila]|uniref:EamA domain-containing protein n=1 Tax=Exophiala mesophila TaxID=212818 RepID=A0A0D1WKD8_EXOME|nr:uncharacterized protein PV10_08968 [Exophiala mesophila]KIV89405.1 hypothetical protein PV10_08968 [Exophiala mesophila]